MLIESGSRLRSDRIRHTITLEAEIISEALGRYLGRTDPGSIKGAIASFEDRVASLELISRYLNYAVRHICSDRALKLTRASE